MDDIHRLKWTRISDLPADWQKHLVVAPTRALVDVWKEQAEVLREKDLFRKFLTRVHRQWAIETGVIEGLYEIGDAGTKTLIAKGFDASFLSHEDTNQPTRDVVDKIKDQYEALMGLYQFVSGERVLGTSYIKQLHQVMTAHQPTYHARDTLGNWVERELPRGKWKSNPNNVEHSDGTIFEFCPPEHVDQEMERLIELHRVHEDCDVSADIEAAWIHHRFSLIHPFTDGNGRVARCLATLVLLKEHWLPLVVTRKVRDKYIAALRAADTGDLGQLVEFIGDLQRRAIREALSLSEEVVSEAKAVASILQSVKQRFAQQRVARQKQIDASLQVADSLQLLAEQRLAEVAGEIQAAIRSEGPNYQCRSDGARHKSEHDYYFYHQTVQAAKSLGYFADRRRYQAWARLVIVTEHRTEVLISFHGIGQSHAGILGCAAMAYTRDKSEDGDNSISEVVPLSEEPFEFVYSEEASEVQKRFRSWLEQCVVEGLGFWQKTV